MADSSPNPNDFFDIERIRRLAELMTEKDLSELDLSAGDIRLRIRRKLEPEMQVVETRPTASSTAGKAAAAAEAIAIDQNVAIIKSPMVGTFYVSSSPESGAYVKVGDHVGPETTVCIIEAMKVFNEIPAETSGKIVAVLVANGEPVEFGQPLFKVEKSG